MSVEEQEATSQPNEDLSDTIMVQPRAVIQANTPQQPSAKRTTENSLLSKTPAKKQKPNKKVDKKRQSAIGQRPAHLLNKREKGAHISLWHSKTHSGSLTKEVVEEKLFVAKREEEVLLGLLDSLKEQEHVIGIRSRLNDECREIEARLLGLNQEVQAEEAKLATSRERQKEMDGTLQDLDTKIKQNADKISTYSDLIEGPIPAHTSDVCASGLSPVKGPEAVPGSSKLQLSTEAAASDASDRHDSPQDAARALTGTNGLTAVHDFDDESEWSLKNMTADEVGACFN